MIFGGSVKPLIHVFRKESENFVSTFGEICWFGEGLSSGKTELAKERMFERLKANPKLLGSFTKVK